MPAEPTVRPALEARALRLAQLLPLLEALARGLAEHLPGWSWSPPPDGSFLWVRLPRGEASELAQVAARHGVEIVAGDTISPDGSFGDHGRLPWCPTQQVIEEGVRRLAQAWPSYAPEGAARPSRIDVPV